MPWLQLKAHLAPSQAELLEELLLEEGACAITLQDGEDQPVFEPAIGTTPLWNDTVLTGLYDDQHGIEPMLERVRQSWAIHCPEDPCPTIEFELLEDRDWEREWMDGFAPMRMGERLWIVPSWHDAPEPEAVNLILDPGLAFGTGTHATTALCLERLDALALAGKLDGKTILDIGCGSGILAIAALKLGADKATGTDIDPQALLASRDNAIRNHIEPERLALYYPEQYSTQSLGQSSELSPKQMTSNDGLPDTHPLPITHPIVIANILAGPLIEMAPMIAGHVAPSGLLSLSGILAYQAEEVRQAYQRQGLVLDELVEREGWVRLDGWRPRP